MPKGTFPENKITYSDIAGEKSCGMYLCKHVDISNAKLIMILY